MGESLLSPWDSIVSSVCCIYYFKSKSPIFFLLIGQSIKNEPEKFLLCSMTQSSLTVVNFLVIKNLKSYIVCIKFGYNDNNRNRFN
jgi:hypothetical protein